MRRILFSVATLAALGLFACHDPVDQAAKARIFSPEDPPKFVTRAAESLDPAHLDQSPEHLRRVLTMTALEAAERLGPHQLETRVEFTWTEADKTVALDELHALTIGSHGDFAAKLDSGDKLGSARQGMEMVRAQGKVFARNRFQKFRERSRDRGAADRYEEQVHDVLGSVYELFDGRFALTPEGETSVAGRRAYRYRLALAERAPQLEPEGSTVPAAAFPKGGPDSHLARELDLEKKKEPRSLSGTLTVDADTAVVLETQLQGSLEAPGEGKARSQLKLKVDQKSIKVSKDLTVSAPKDALPDEERPQSIAATLERFDLPRARTADAGIGSAPADTDDEDK